MAPGTLIQVFQDVTNFFRNRLVDLRNVTIVVRNCNDPNTVKDGVCLAFEKARNVRQMIPRSSNL